MMSSPVSASFDISRPTGRCSATDTAFEAGDPYVASLSDDPVSGKTQRVDFSPDAWANGSRPKPPLVLFATWRATMPDRDRPESFLATGELVDVFEQLVLGDDGIDGGINDEVVDVDNDPERHSDPEADAAKDPTSAARESRSALRYLLALTLLRKRALVLDSQQPATRNEPGVLRVRRWTRAGEPQADVLEVIEPHITGDRLAELATMFAEIIDPGQHDEPGGGA